MPQIDSTRYQKKKKTMKILSSLQFLSAPSRDKTPNIVADFDMVKSIPGITISCFVQIDSICLMFWSSMNHIFYSVLTVNHFDRSMAQGDGELSCDGAIMCHERILRETFRNGITNLSVPHQVVLQVIATRRCLIVLFLSLP